MTLSLEGPHWQFALKFYRQPGAAAACLTLQAEADLDIIHLILLLYAEVALGRPSSRDEIALARERMTAWREAAVLPLRGIRRFLKPIRAGFPEQEKLLRAQVKNAELFAEKIQLAFAVSWLSQQPVGNGLPIEDALHVLVESYRGRQLGDDASILRALHIVLDTTARLRRLAGWAASM